MSVGKAADYLGLYTAIGIVTSIVAKTYPTPCVISAKKSLDFDDSSVRRIPSTVRIRFVTSHVVASAI